jgi:hypothetical protein
MAAHPTAANGATDFERPNPPEPPKPEIFWFCLADLAHLAMKPLDFFEAS